MTNPTPQHVPHQARILVVDDDPGMLRAVTRVLGRQYEIVPAASPAEALALDRSVEPDLAVLDIRMPEMNGFQLMEQLTARWPPLDVIFMTGDVAELDANLIRAIEQGAFYFIQKPFDHRVLQSLVQRCLELRRLRRQEQRHLRRLERELQAARRFQHSLLPPASRQIAGLSIGARSQACVELGGDFYDYAQAADDQAAVVVADVSGHGASAAMMTGIVKSAFHGARLDGFQPRAVIDRVAEGISEFDAARFVTLFGAVIDVARSELVFASAGHPPALLRRADGMVEALDSTGPLISSGFRGIAWDRKTVSLEPDDQLLVYTDGVTEAQVGDGMFGTERVRELLAASPRHGLELIDELFEAVQRGNGGRPQADDMTALTVGRLNPAV